MKAFCTSSRTRQLGGRVGWEAAPSGDLAGQRRAWVPRALSPRVGRAAPSPPRELAALARACTDHVPCDPVSP